MSSMCGIITPNGRDCPEPTVTGSPLNLCAKHLRQAAELYSSLHDQVPERRVRERCPQCNTMALHAIAEPPTIVCALCGYERKVTPAAIPTLRQSATHIDSGDPIVYYIRFGDRIKIGTTRNLTTRLAALPHEEVLGVERGDRELEHERHLQFAHLRLSRRGEWFTSGADLLAHIATLNEMTAHSAL